MTLSVIGPNAKAMIGRETPWGEPLEIEKGAVLKFARSIGDAHPLYSDASAAAALGFDKLMVPVSFFDFNMPSGDEREITWQIPLPLVNRVRGKDKIELLHPVYVGDSIQARSRVLDVYEKKGKTGPIVFIVAETEYRNQEGTIVMRHQITSVRR